MNRATVLATAATLIRGDREKTHGDARLVYGLTADLWSAYLGVTLCARDVTQCLSLMKKARTKYGQHNDDDYIDDVGYVALASEVGDG